MALIKCPECGREVSDSAKQCPHCGFTLKTNIDTAKQAASVAGNAALNALLKYGTSIIPFALLIIGMLYLLIGFDNWYHDYYCDYLIRGSEDIITPFSDDAFYLPLIATIVFPIGILIACRKAYKKTLNDSSAIQHSKFSKHIILWMILVYVVGFAALSAIFYSDYTKAKEEQANYIATPTSKWVYSEETNLSGAKIRYATVTSQEDNSINLILEYDPDNYKGLNDLTTRYFDKSINVVSKYSSIKRGINLQFDGGEVMNQTPSGYADANVYLTSKAIMIRDECSDFSRIMNLLKSSSVCKIEIVTSKGLQTYTFDVAGLNWSAF